MLVYHVPFVGDPFVTKNIDFTPMNYIIKEMVLNKLSPYALLVHVPDVFSFLCVESILIF
jgi:hypothetical protein